MNPDGRHNVCSAPQQAFFKKEELADCQFTVGSVVWAKLDGWPWWPALVDDDPNIEEFCWSDFDEDRRPMAAVRHAIPRRVFRQRRRLPRLD